MGYTLYFSTGEERCNSVRLLRYKPLDQFVCMLPKNHGGDHVAWVGTDCEALVWARDKEEFKKLTMADMFNIRR